MATKAEMKQPKIKLKIRKGDQVMITSGKDRGKQGIVSLVFPKKQRLIVLQENSENPEEPIPLNAVVKHFKDKTNQGQSARFLKAAPLHMSNVMLIDPKLGVPTKVGRRVENGKIVRFAKKSGETIIESIPEGLENKK